MNNIGEDILHYKYSIKNEGKSATMAHKGLFEKICFPDFTLFYFYYTIGFLEKSANKAHQKIKKMGNHIV